MERTKTLCHSIQVKETRLTEPTLRTPSTLNKKEEILIVGAVLQYADNGISLSEGNLLSLSRQIVQILLYSNNRKVSFKETIPKKPRQKGFLARNLELRVRPVCIIDASRVVFVTLLNIGRPISIVYETVKGLNIRQFQSNITSQ